ncbi:MAG TPA: DUF4386 family protein [Terracidiphilus sp.]|nr:DUF4386 family protein [Terracidiphilus sp.]
MITASLHRTARTAGAFYLLAVLSALAGEFILHGRVAIGLGLVAVACYIVVTFLFFAIFKVISRNLTMAAIAANLAGLALEALRWNPGGIDIAMVFHGLYCILIGYLMAKSGFLPRILGGLMIGAGLIWLLYLDSPLVNAISPWNTIVGLIGEGLPCLWFLGFGLRAPHRGELASAGGD